jgi:surfeit locus 1 family protein
MLNQFRPALVPTLITVPMVALMIGLGVWQLARMHWKHELIAQVESQLGASPIDLPASGIDPVAFNYQPVQISGVFHHDKEIHLIAHTRKGQLGYHVITPLERPNGDFVMINRGWVPTLGRNAETRQEAQLEGRVEIRGIARKPWPQARFVPDNDIEKNVWFYGDIAQMTEHLGISAGPVFVEADATPNPGGWPLGGQTRVTFVNNHVQYAITWFGLAITLVVIYLLYHRREGRL